MICVDKIHAGRSDFHQHLAWRGLGFWEIAIPQRPGIAGLFDENGFHNVRILRLVCTTTAKSSRYKSENGKSSRAQSAGPTAEPLRPIRTRPNFAMIRQCA